jgi:hypothetical protein
METIDQLRLKGYCVIVFTPEEIGTANPRKVAEEIVSRSWQVIEELQD